MARAAAPAVKHLTEEELGARWGVGAAAVAEKRKNGTGPAYLPITEGRTKQTIRYRLVDVEAWEDDHLRVPATA